MEVMQQHAEEVEEPSFLLERRQRTSWHPDYINGFHSDQHVEDQKNRVSDNIVYVDDNGEGAMEVMQQHAEEVEEPSFQLEQRQRTSWHPDYVNGFHSDQHVEDQKNRISDNIVYVDDNGENLKAEGLDIPKLVNAVINNQSAGNDLEEIVVSGLNDSSLGQTSWEVENISESVGATEKVRIEVVDENENDVIELEFERAAEKVHTHTAHCPNCNKQITKVVLRRRKPESSGVSKPLDCFGCLSCFSIFFPSGKSLNPLRIFEYNKKVEKKDGLGSNLPASPGSTSGKGNLIVKPGNAFDLLWIFGKRGDRKTSLKPEGDNDAEHKEPAGKATNESQDPGKSVKIDIRPGASHDLETPVEPGTDQLRTTTDENGGKPAEISNAGGIKSLEILKCIVYGGLLESITSLGVVSSAAASDAKTLNIIALGLANVIGGLFVIAQSLVNLKNEDSGGSPNQETHRYQELLGRRRHFSLHATLAILSFLVFGLIPPLVYGFAFRVSDNKDHKILAVAASSLASIIILATAKTYTKGPEKFNAYIKTGLYYCAMAFAVSGVSYAAGDLIKILMEKLDLFESTPPGSGVASSFISNTNPTTPASAWAYY